MCCGATVELTYIKWFTQKSKIYLPFPSKVGKEINVLVYLTFVPPTIKDGGKRSRGLGLTPPDIKFHGRITWRWTHYRSRFCSDLGVTSSCDSSTRSNLACDVSAGVGGNGSRRSEKRKTKGEIQGCLKDKPPWYRAENDKESFLPAQKWEEDAK